MEISPREDNVQNNVAVKMKFDQRFNVTSERQDNARSSVVRAGVQRGGEGASLIFAPVEWGASWLAPWQERQRHENVSEKSKRAKHGEDMKLERYVF